MNKDIARAIRIALERSNKTISEQWKLLCRKLVEVIDDLVAKLAACISVNCTDDLLLLSRSELQEF